MAYQSSVLVESRLLRGDGLALLVKAMRTLAESTEGHLSEVDFSISENEVHIVSLWRDAVALRAFVEEAHSLLIAHRERHGAFPTVERTLWWSEGTPTPDETRGREEHLRAHGPGSRAFTLASPVPA
ncbi:DUF3291 domain-containing protein [Nocardiopsis lambiniae]|uniref:DUF3291 domain-containing protein n=1 Tax=Nocardiopsis lambiniae TaxID=3075539 RepID=A0ABU2M4C8_9ACTN|nr:DUF3291 domain-containing protein [Nocardiopsis sp. DSM 44743]MDT0327511.1 DUF3291 domain-containing protein [Nocardiopsis sp. DSM 44743]